MDKIWWFFTYAFIFVLCIAAVILCVMFVKIIYRGYIIPYRKLENAKKSADKYTHATLSEKSTEVRRDGHGSTTVHLFIFDFSDGTRKIFDVNRDVYYKYEKGDEGTLTYKELNETRVFVSFQSTR